MNAPSAIRDARRRAGLTQVRLAARAGTSQATLSAYENGRKQPSVETLDRLLAAAGARLEVAPRRVAVIVPDHARLERAGRELANVIALAAALPSRHERRLRFPRLPAPAA